MVEIYKTEKGVGVFMVALGKGDVIIGETSYLADKQFFGITFKNSEVSHEIGSISECKGTPQAILSFSNIESLEVVEKALSEIKAKLKEQTYDN